MKTLLITGASGFLGWHLCSKPPDGWRIIGAYQHNEKGIYPGTENTKLDLLKENEVWLALKTIKADAVFHLAANSSTAECEKEPEKTRKLNVDASVRLAEMCADQKIRLVFVSSEQVYSGLNSIYVESEWPEPGHEYGRQKLEAENRLLKIQPDIAIARIAVLYGLLESPKKSFLQQWIDAWQRFVPVTAFDDEFRSFLSVDSAVEALTLLLEQGAIGKFNVGGADSMSRYDFAELASQILNLENAGILKKSQHDVKTDAFRPPNLKLDLSKITGIGFEARHAEEELLRMSKLVKLNQPFSGN